MASAGTGQRAVTQSSPVLAAAQPVAEVAETVRMPPPVRWFTTCLTRLLGMANPTPMLPEDWAPR